MCVFPDSAEALSLSDMLVQPFVELFVIEMISIEIKSFPQKENCCFHLVFPPVFSAKPGWTGANKGLQKTV